MASRILPKRSKINIRIREVEPENQEICENCVIHGSIKINVYVSVITYRRYKNVIICKHRSLKP